MQYDDNAEKYGYEGEMEVMKCDKLQRYSLDVDHEEQPFAVPDDDGAYMDASDVMEAITELKEAWRCEHEAYEALKAKLAEKVEEAK